MSTSKWGALLAALLWIAPPAWADDDDDASEASEEQEQASAGTSGERGIALSAGTGPQPLNQLTLGVTGLGARLLLPAGGGSLFLSGGHTSVRGSNFPDEGFADRDFFRMGGTTLMVGYRGGHPPEDSGVVPYGIGGPMVVRGVTGEGSAGDDVFRNSLWSVGALLGFGIDGFVNRHLSAGVELGGVGGIALGGNRWRGETNDAFSGFGIDGFVNRHLSAGVELGGVGGIALGGNRWRGETNDAFSGFGLSSYASAQLTVWK